MCILCCAVGSLYLKMCVMRGALRSLIVVILLGTPPAKGPTQFKGCDKVSEACSKTAMDASCCSVGQGHTWVPNLESPSILIDVATCLQNSKPCLEKHTVVQSEKL